MEVAQCLLTRCLCFVQVSQTLLPGKESLILHQAPLPSPPSGAGSPQGLPLRAAQGASQAQIHALHSDPSAGLGAPRAHLAEEQLLLRLPLPGLQLLLRLCLLLVALDGLLLHLHHAGQRWGLLLARGPVAVGLLQQGLVLAQLLLRLLGVALVLPRRLRGFGYDLKAAKPSANRSSPQGKLTPLPRLAGKSSSGLSRLTIQARNNPGKGQGNLGMKGSEIPCPR